MTTQYTPTLKLALPVTGELSGTWGDIVNDNITSMIEQAIAGLATINTWTGNAHTLTTANGTTSESRCAMLVAATGGGAPSAAAEIICPAAAKLYVLQNNTSYAVTLKTSAGTGVAVAAGDTAFLFCDGTNVNSCVTTIVNGHITGNLTVDGNATINGNTTLGNATSDTVTVTARVASNVLPSADNTYDLGASANAWKDLYIDGTATMALVAISGGTINGVSIGATTPATFLAVDNLSLDGNTIASTDTNGNVVIAPNGTGDVQLDADTVRVGDSGAAATLTSNGAGALTVTTGGAADLTLSTNSGTDSGTVVIANGANGNITLTPNGTGDVILSADRTQFGDANTDTTLTTNGTGSLNLTTNNGTNSGTIQIAQGANGNITLTPNGTGSVSVPKLVWSNGTATRVPYLTTGGQFTDSANLTFNGTDLTVSGAVNAGTINATTLDLTNLEVTNIKAKDGTASITIADSTGAVSFANNVTLGDASTDTVQVNGSMGVGGAASAGHGIYFNSVPNSSTFASAVTTNFVFPATTTSYAASFQSNISAIAGSYTTPNVYGFVASNMGAVGAGATVTNLHGFYVADQTRGTNNYGITSLVSSGSNKWNIYASGTAANYFAGKALVGTTTDQDGRLIVRSTGNNYASSAVAIVDSANTTKLQMLQTTSGFFYMTVNGTDDFVLKPTESVFNESGGDIDFRVESDTNTHALFVDAGNSRVGMNVSAPATELEVRGVTPIRASRDAQITGSGTGFGQYAFAARYDASNYIEGAAITALSNAAWSASSIPTYLSFRTGGSASGSLVERLALGNTGTVFNDSGEDIDFRVESDTNTHALFVDAGNSVVAVGTSETTDPWTNYTPFAVGNLFMVGSTGASSTFTNMVHGGYYNGTSWLQRATDVTVARYEMVGNVLGASHNFYTANNVTADTATTQILNLTLKPSEAVFNEDSRDIDFRVESDTNTHALFVDAGNSRVGINQSAPETQLHIGNTSTTESNMTLAGEYQSSGFTNYNAFNFQHGSFVRARISSTQYAASSDSFVLNMEIANGSLSGYNNYLKVNGTSSDNGGSVVINEGGLAEIDFRVESDTNTHALFVDAGNSRVGVNASAPVTTFQVLSAGNNYEPSSGTGYGDFYVGSGTYGLAIGPATGGGGAGDVRIWPKGGTATLIFTNATNSNSVLQLYPTAVVVNESGADQDFRVESDANTHMLYVDAGVNTVSVGTSIQPTAPADFRAYSGVHTAHRVISAIGDIYNSGSGRTFTITGGSNGSLAYLSFTAMNHNGTRVETYFFYNASGTWNASTATSQTAGTPPTVTVSGSGTATMTVQIIGAGGNPSFYTGGIMNYEFYGSYVSIA